MKNHELPTIKDIVVKNRTKREVKRKETAEFQKKQKAMFDPFSLEQMIQDGQEYSKKRSEETIEKIRSIYDKLSIERKINYQVTLRNKEINDSLERLDKLNKRYDELLKKETGNNH